MANDEVLRLRATVISEEGLAQIRMLGREIGLLPARARPAVTQLNTGFATLTSTVKNLGNELTRMVPSLGGFGLGAAGAGLAAAALIRTLTSISGRIVELKYASKELGMSERDIRAWGLAAEKAGISTDAMMSGLKGFKQTSEEFKYNIGGVRDELIALGAGPVVQRITAATTQTEKLKAAFDFKEALQRADPSGYKARKFMEMIGLGADAARLSWAEFSDAMAKTQPLSQEQIDRAKKFHDGMVQLGHAWDQLLQKSAIGMFPKLEQDIKDVEQIIGLLDKISAWFGSEKGEDPIAKFSNWLLGGNAALPKSQSMRNRGAAPHPDAPTVPTETNPLLQQRAPNYNPRSGYKPTSFGDGFGAGGGLSEFSRAVKDGVFAALVDFKSYAETGGAAAGGGGGGFTPASFGGSAGAAAGGGVGGRAPGAAGFGGGGYSNLTPGTGGGTAGPEGGGAGAAPGSAPLPSGGGAGVPGGSRGGSAGITAPAGAAIQRKGMATVTTAGGRKFQVDERFAPNFQGFINDYEKAGGVIGPESGTLGSRPHNPSGHPIGAAIDINQIGYGVRGRGGKTLPVEAENELAKKWGLVSGANWRRPDTGHFGIRGVDEARQALIDQGVEPGKATDIAKAQVEGKTVKGSWFGNAPGWRDPSEPASSPKSNVPGIALRDKSTMGKMFEVTTPDGRKFMLPQTDWGPAARTGRGIDITAAAGAQMGYTSKNFPTGGNFSYRRMDEQIASPTMKAEGNVNLTVNSNGTAAKTSASSDGFWQKTTIQNYKQMQKTEAPNWGPG